MSYVAIHMSTCRNLTMSNNLQAAILLEANCVDGIYPKLKFWATRRAMPVKAAEHRRGVAVWGIGEFLVVLVVKGKAWECVAREGTRVWRVPSAVYRSQRPRRWPEPQGPCPYASQR